MTRGERIVVDARRILEGEAPDFQLRAGDIVYAPNVRVKDWDETLRMLAPSLGVIGRDLTPLGRRYVLLWK